MTFSEAQLEAYLNGTLEPSVATALEEALDRDPALEARLLAQEPLAAPIRLAFDGIPGQERLDTLAGAIPAAPPDRAWPARGLAGAAIAAVCAALGFAVATMTQPVAAPDWQEQVAQYQALYAPETIAHLDSGPALLQAQLARASTALGREITLEEVSGVDGLSLRRAQILSFEGTPLIQIVYATQTGTPVALCILGQPDGAAAAPRYAERAGVPTSHWADGRYGYMVLGRLDAAALSDITEHLAARL
ncbi:MAG: hypothetical protein AAGB05_02470 [Pseudomonadota bacterium]